MHRVVLILCTLIAITNTIDWDICFHCLCFCTKNCSTEYGCERDYCGPFAITPIYWIDAGQPVLEGETMVNMQAYVRCVTDFDCARTTVYRYMMKHEDDCNKDGVIDCYDYFTLHVWGLKKCKFDHRTTDKDKAFNACMIEFTSDHNLI